ncbi:DUF6891 domain-containing protein [Hyphomonas chukchiensis]|uniref:DUF6891 domain-containing protein n=1 Tax=Hyphomonas chukchiensis TaxID=1280947 RepID=A0A062TZN9_9PROT|nr:hypothetical protein [Hyphomonas chukchiensis]KCZ53526.1 hypothetical protein HY30_11175 [Hyphomonas chukchiensis]
MTKLKADERDDLKMWARIHVRGGYEEADEIEEILYELTEDFETPMSERDRRIEVRNALIGAAQTLVDEQDSWPVLTDYDRLELAMDTLEDNGVVARANFTCCGNCGAAEIGAEIEDYEALGQVARGYVFFHQQDTESAVEGHGLYFSYGAAHSEHDAAHIAIAQELFDLLVAVGLKPHWDGKIDHRVGVVLDWKRRWVDGVPTPLKRWSF